MKPAFIILLALGGLMFIQFRLLMVGVRFEKQRLDLRIEAALQKAVISLDDDPALVRQLGDWLPKADDSNTPAPTLDSLLRVEMQRAGISARLSFAITDLLNREVFLTSPDFDETQFHFGRYAARLGPVISERCACQRALHLDIPNLYTYLLGELDYLVIPSALCLLVLLAGLFFLLNTLRREEKLNQIKNDFINHLTHELKTPAFSISLSAKMAQEQLAAGHTEKAAEYLRIIRRENDTLKRQVEKVLELGSLQSGRYTLQREATHLHPLIREVAAEFDSAARAGSFQLQLDAANDLIKVDAGHFANALRNLLDNALKYSKDSPAITVSTRIGDGYFEMSVSDRGIGIPLSAQKFVFDKFYRVPQTGSEAVKGFGLGLSYVREIARAHRGTVSLTSEPGSGTTVSTHWPLA